MSTNYRTVTPTPHKLIICPQIVGGMTFLVLVLYLIVFLGMQRWNVPPLNPIQGGVSPELTIQGGGGKHLRYIFWPYLLNGSSDLYEI